MSSKIELTENEGKYLKLIYRRQREESKEIRTTDIADFLQVRPATVTEVLQNLDSKGMIRHESYKGVELTRMGVEKARNLLRRHRILETLFVNYLGFDEGQACEEAIQIDQHVSEYLIDSICKSFGHPSMCPCGKRIFGSSKCEG